jgi:hypothetical protein
LLLSYWIAKLLDLTEGHKKATGLNWIAKLLDAVKLDGQFEP